MNKNKNEKEGERRRRVLMVPVAHETGSSTPSALASDAAVRGKLLFQAKQVKVIKRNKTKSRRVEK
jgi:hypothetical protein